MMGTEPQNLHLILAADPDRKLGELWLGNLKSANNVTALKGRGIKTVVSVINNIELAYTRQDNIVHHYYAVPDIPTYKINTIFEETNQNILDGLKRGNVLVHCVAGVSRSATLVIAFLMSTRGWGYEKAFCFVRERRNVNPNSGFRLQLVNYSKEIFHRMKQEGVPDRGKSFFQSPKDQAIKENKSNNAQPYVTQIRKSKTLHHKPKMSVKTRPSELLDLPSVDEVADDDSPIKIYNPQMQEPSPKSQRVDTQISLYGKLKRYQSDPKIRSFYSKPENTLDEKTREQYMRRLHENYLKLDMSNNYYTESPNPNRRAEIMKRLERIALNDTSITDLDRSAIVKSNRPVPKYNAAALYRSNYVV